MSWTHQQALELCRKIEAVCPQYGCHVALTGGLLYKQPGLRKDCDILFYRIRQRKSIDMLGLWRALSAIGLEKNSGCGWCFKARYENENVDILFPEQPGGEHLYKPKPKKII